METYLVGGAVRDGLLGLPVGERDYVVVGGTPAQMRALGFKAVGRDFPVFLHPQTGEEYALARTERKVGPGHQGFAMHASPEVTLEEDLLRRDLTINAMAKQEQGALTNPRPPALPVNAEAVQGGLTDPQRPDLTANAKAAQGGLADPQRPDLTASAEAAQGGLIDPYGGLADLRARRLRHVSAAFVEDPLRVLRLARFKARLHHLGFAVAAETLALARQMVADGLLQELTAERVLGELKKALGTESPAEFFLFLVEVSAHDGLWPEIETDRLRGLAKLPGLRSAEARLGYLFREADAEAVKGFCQRLRWPRKTAWLLERIGARWADWQRVGALDAAETLALLHDTAAFRQGDSFQAFNTACAEMLNAETPSKATAESGKATAESGKAAAESGKAAAESGKATAESGKAAAESGKGTELAALWRSLQQATSAVSAADVAAGLQGAELGAAIEAERLQRIAKQQLPPPRGSAPNE